MVNTVLIFRYSAIIRKFLVNLLSKSFKEHCLFEKKGSTRKLSFLFILDRNAI